MKKILFLLLPIILFAEHIYTTKPSAENKKAMENPKIKCRWVCDKKIYTEQKIAEAISYYKHSEYYNFKKKEF
jgi:hypothetical protein